MLEESSRSFRSDDFLVRVHIYKNFGASPFDVRDLWNASEHQFPGVWIVLVLFLVSTRNVSVDV